jgi:hypothetical protein
MSKKVVSQKAEVNPNVFMLGSNKIELVKQVEIGGQKVDCVLVHTYLKKQFKDLLPELARADLQTLSNYIRQSVYIPLTLPEALQNDAKVTMLGRVFPKWEILPELLSKVQALNPSHSIRDGNTHHILLGNGGMASIGAVMLFCLGIGQMHLSPKGNPAGSYHPLLALANMYKAGYRAEVSTKSPLYMGIAGAFQIREEEHIQKALTKDNARLSAKPTKKAKK